MSSLAAGSQPLGRDKVTVGTGEVAAALTWPSQRAEVDGVKVLLISPLDVFPPDDGGRRRIYSFVKGLAQRHEVAFVCPRIANRAAVDLALPIYEVNLPGPIYELFYPPFVLRLRQIMREERPDVLHLEFIWHGLHAVLARFPGHPILAVNSHNVEGDRFRQTGRRTWRLVSLYERWVLSRADRVFVVSDDDCRRFVDRGVDPAKMQVLPNGFDRHIFYPNPEARPRVLDALGLPADTRLLLFFGQFAYQPNREAIEALGREVMPRLDTSVTGHRLALVGKGLIPVVEAARTHPRILSVGRVDAIADYINAADVVLVPVQAGGGTRLKIIESIACGKTVVSTQVGAEGIDARLCGDHLRISRNWEEFAALTVEALNGPMWQEATQAFTDEYEWDSIVARLRYCEGTK